MEDNFFKGLEKKSSLFLLEFFWLEFKCLIALKMHHRV